MAKYYGNREILDIKDAEPGFKEVHLEGEKTQIISEKMLAVVPTDEAVDLTTLRDRECEPVIDEIFTILNEYKSSMKDDDKRQEAVQKILVVLHQWNVKLVDIEHIFDTFMSEIRAVASLTSESLNYSFDKASEMLYGGVGKYTRRMQDVHKVLVQNTQVSDNVKPEDETVPSDQQ